MSRYQGRIYAPPGRYFSGDDKELLLQAADYTLLPSRFEPCGLVDIEFGWNGALVIGHDTGGLGKMPGVYFKVESSSQSHLAAKLGCAVVDAVSMSPETKKEMVAKALTTSFPVPEMTKAIADIWEEISKASEKTRLAQMGNGGDRDSQTANQMQFYDQVSSPSRNITIFSCLAHDLI